MKFRREFVLQESVFTRHGSERLLNDAFNLARTRDRKHVTVATKSNGIAISANPVAMMLDFLGHRDAHDAILRAIGVAAAQAGDDPDDGIRTGGSAASGWAIRPSP